MSVPPAVQTRFAWLVVTLLFLGSVLNYLDRAVLGVVQVEICAELGLSNADYGLALNAFLLTYMVFYIVGGHLADRLGYRRTFTLTLVFWSVANMLHAAVRGLGSLSLFRALLGVGEGGFYPTAMRGAADWFPAAQRAKAIGLLLCGLCVGTMLAQPLVTWLTGWYGWRAAFLATGALGFALVPPWLLLHHRVKRRYGTADPAPAYLAPVDLAPTPQPRQEHVPRASNELSLFEVLRSRKYLCLLTARALTDGAWWFYLFWIPGYFRRVREFDLTEVGLYLWIPYLLAELGALAGAWAATALIQRGLSIDRGRKCILVPAALLGTLGALTYFVAEPWLAVALVSAALFGQFAWAANMHTAISEVVPPRRLAVLYGITGAVGTLMGALTQPLIGLLVDRGGYVLPFVSVGVAWVVALGLLLAAGRIEPLRRRPAAVVPTRAEPAALQEGTRAAL